MKASLRVKLLVPTLGVVVLCMGLSGFLSARKAAEELRGTMLSSAKLLSQNLTRSLNSFTDDLLAAVTMQSKLDRVRKALIDKTPESVTQARAALTDLMNFDSSIQAANLLDPQGETVASSDPAAKGNFADREYFKKAISGTKNISEPFLSRVTNKPVFAVAAPVLQDGKPVGVIYIRVDLDKFSQDMVAPVKIGQNGFAYMADKNGVVFSYPDPSQVLKLKLGELSFGKTMLANKEGSLEYEFEGKKIAAAYSKEANTSWVAVIAVDESDITNASSGVRNTGLLLAGLGIVLVSISIVLVLNHMLVSLGHCVSFAEAVSGGSLNAELNDHRSDELGVLADSLRAMVKSLREIIATAESKTEEANVQSNLANEAMEKARLAQLQAENAKREGMLSAASQLEGVVEVVSSASDELSAQIDLSSQGSEEQAKRVSETATAMEEMNATVLEVAQNASNAAKTADQAKSKAEEGSKVVQQVVSGIEQVRNQAQEMRVDMDALGQQAEGIGRIMNVISDIADQTNLLALNAAIEAARAGDAGRGFAVVADEVRKLAEKTMTATKEVGEAILGIQQGTRKNSENVERSGHTIEEATRLASLSGEALKEIVTLVESTSDQVRAIATASEEQSAASEEINRSIEEVSRISSETAEAMQQSARAVNDLATQSQVLRNLIEDLKHDENTGTKALAHNPRALPGRGH